LELRELRTLDISEEKDTHTFEMFVPGVAKIADFLNASDSLPHLTSLDISGMALRVFLVEISINISSIKYK
jgi:hypothetical protein